MYDQRHMAYTMSEPQPPQPPGSACRRRERRLRSHLCHERMAVAMALAESLHRSAQRPKTARPGERHEMHYTATFRKRLSSRGASQHLLPEVAGWQTRVLRHEVEHLSVLALDVPEPQMVDQLPDIEQFFRALSLDPEQVIEVPKILPFDVPVRTAVRVPQLVEQLVEVPTIISYSSFQRTVEHHVDIPVPGGGGPSSGLQGFSSGQSSTATPSSKKRISERIVDGCLHGSRPGQGSSSSHSPAGVEERADEPGEWVFRTFTKIKVRSWLRTRVRGCPPVSAHPRRRLSSWLIPCRSPLSGCSSGTATLARPTTGTDALERLSGRHQLVSRSSGTELGMRRGSSTTGTGIRVSVRMTSLLFLLGEGRHRQPRAVYKYWAPSLLCRNFLLREQWSLVLPSTWLGSDHWLYGCTRTSVRSGLRSIPSPSLWW